MAKEAPAWRGLAKMGLAAIMKEASAGAAM